MTLFTTDYIKNLFDFKFPDCCNEWDNGQASINTHRYAFLLKSFVNSTSNFDEQIKYANSIKEILKLNYTDDEFVDMIKLYNKLIDERQQIIEQSKLSCCSFWTSLDNIPNLSEENKDLWGSKRQYLFGQVCSDIIKYNKNINLHPFLCSALNPTGGICGPGNTEIYAGSINDSVVIHSCIHDASGYLYNYHQMGLGYNYVNTYFSFPTSSPLSCQIAGTLFCSFVKYSMKK